MLATQGTADGATLYMYTNHLALHFITERQVSRKCANITVGTLSELHAVLPPAVDPWLPPAGFTNQNPCNDLTALEIHPAKIHSKSDLLKALPLYHWYMLMLNKHSGMNTYTYYIHTYVHTYIPTYIHTYCRTGFNCVVKLLRVRVLKMNCVLIIALLRYYSIAVIQYCIYNSCEVKKYLHPQLSQ